jgi:hypothetical protein
MKIAKLKYRVALCSMKDVVESDGTMSLTREGVTWTWAAITSAVNLPSFMGVSGYAVLESTSRMTHKIVTRALPHLDITSAAWIYEERGISAPRWYKFLGVAESDCWWSFSVHLVEKSDNVQPPVTNALRAQPSQVAL